MVLDRVRISAEAADRKSPWLIIILQCIVIFEVIVDPWHFFHFRDGPQETARKLGVFTDGEPNDPPSSTSNQVLIRFRSNTEKGGLFRISYQGI